MFSNKFNIQRIICRYSEENKVPDLSISYIKTNNYFSIYQHFTYYNNIIDLFLTETR